MAQSVDTKIVELKFNNDNFADKIDSTLTKLEQLNKDIKEVGLTDALKNLNKNVKDVDLNGITKGVEETTKGFSKMEVFAVTAMANISNSVVNLGKKMANHLIAPIKQGVMAGGLARARNIEQATFQFEGQKIGKSKGHETLSYYHEVMEAVLGTSYSYDVAAKAASQLAASNVGVEKSTRKLADGTEIETKVLNEGMTKALLGIAGVASMTGRSFDDVSRVFTKVAGNNRVYAQDLQSIASMGLNAAAVLGQQMGKTEEQINDMVKKGDIHFAEFSKAMSDAFGLHAKDSTLMFQGALDDVNAALARIGADFYGPALNAGRDILNSITPLVDAIHTRLNPALSKSGSLMEVASKRLSQYLDMLSYVIERFPNDANSVGDWIREHMNAWTNIADLYKRGDLMKAIDGLDDYMSKVKGMEGKGINGRQMLIDYLKISNNSEVLSHYLNKSQDDIDALLKKGKIGFKELSTVIDGMVKDGTIGFNTFYKAFKQLWGQSDKLINIPGVTKAFDKYVRVCIRAGGPTEQFTNNVETLFKIFSGLGSLFDSTKQILGGLASIFLTIAQHLAPLGTLLVDVSKELAVFIVQLADSIATSQHFSSMIDSVVSMLLKLFEVLHLDKIAGAALMGITKAFDYLAIAIEKVQEGAAKVFAVVAKYFNALVDKLYALITDFEALRQLAENLKKVGLIVALVNLVSYLTKPAEMFDALSKSITNVGDSFVGMLKNIGGVFKAIAGLAGKIGAAIDEVTNTLKRMQEMIIATAILEIAIAIGVLAGALYLLAKVPWKELDKSAPAVLSFMTILGTLFAGSKVLGGIESSIKVWEKAVNDIESIGKAMLEFAVAVGVMALAIKMLAGLDKNQLLYAVGAVEVLLITLGVIAKFLTMTTTSSKDTGIKALWSGKSTKTSQSMTKGLLGLVAMAEAINIIAKALTNIATIDDPERLYDSLSAIEILLWSLFAVTKFLSGNKANSMTKGVTSLLAMAIAIRLLTKPIAELASIDPDSMWRAVGAVDSLVLALSIMTQMMSGGEKMISIGIGILLVAAAVRMLGDVVAAFSMLDPETMVHGIIGVVGMLAALTFTMNFMDPEGMLSKAVALVLVGHMLKELQDVVMNFGANFETAIKGLGAIGVALTGLLFACYAFEAVPTAGILKLFAALMLGAVVVTSFGVAIGIFGVGVGIFGLGLQSMAAGVAEASAVSGPFIAIMVGFAIAIGLLSSVGLPAVGVILALSLAFLLLGVGMEKMGRGMENIAMAIKLISDMKGELGSLSFQIISFVKDLKKLINDASKVGEAFKSIATPLASIRKSIITLNENVDKLTASFTALQTDTVDSINSLTTSLTTLSTLNQDSFTKATEAIKGFITELSSVSADSTTVSSAAANISTSITTLNTTVSEALNTLSLFQQRIRMFDAIGESLNSIATPISLLNSLKGELAGLVEDIINFVNNLKTMKDNAATVAEGATAISTSLTEIGNAAKVVSDSFTSFTSTTADTLTKMGEGLNAIASGVAKLSKNKNSLDQVSASIESFYKKLESVNATADDISSGTAKVAKAIQKLGSAAKTSIDTTKLVSSGKQIVDSLINGINGSKDKVGSKMVSIVDSAAQKVRKRRDNFKSVGSYLIEGMIAGIRSQQHNLEYQVQQLEAKAERAVKAKAKIQSPSKVWMKIGGYMGEGLAIGISNSGIQVKQASLGLASVSEDAVASAISAISSAIEDGWDTDPVITPVVDLSNINRSANAINSAFNSSIGIGTSGRLARSVSGIQNGGRSSLASSLSDLTDKLGSVSETMNSRNMTNYITVDGAEDPMLFADKLVRGLKLNARTI